MLRLALTLLAFCACTCSAQNSSAGNSSGTGSKDAILQADFRILGYDVLPFTSNKQNAVIVGVANVLGNGVALSDIELSVLNTYDNATAYGNRRLLQTAFPAVDTRLRIQTNSSIAQQQASTLAQGTNVTYSLAGAIGAQGLQTQQIVLQSTQVEANQPPPTAPSEPPPTPSPQPSPTSSAPVPQASESPMEAPSSPSTTTSSPSPTADSPAPSALNSGSASSNSAASSSKSSLSGGAIAGIAVGGAAVIALLALLGFFALRRRSQTARQHEDLAYLSQRSKPDSSGGNSSNIVAYGSPTYIPQSSYSEICHHAPEVFSPAGGIGSHRHPPAGAVSNTRVDDKTEHGLATEKIEV